MNRTTPRRVTHGDESGFTLIELLIVIVILPLVAGAITVVMTTTLTNENVVSSRLTGSADTELTSAVFVRDVESSSFVTTEETIAGPYSAQSPQLCGTQGDGATFLIGFYWPNNEATYWYLNGQLVRRDCAVLSGYTTSSQFSSLAIARSLVSTPIVAIEPQSDLPSLETSWLSTDGVTNVGLDVGVSGQNAYSYALSGTPRIWLPALAGFSGGGAPPAPLLLLNDDTSCEPPPPPVLTESGAAVVSISNGTAPLAVVTPCPGSLQLGIPKGSPALEASSIITADPNMNSVAYGSGTTNYPSTETYESTAIPNPYASLTAPINPTTSPSFTGSCTSGQCSPGQYSGSLTIGANATDTFMDGTYVFTGAVTIDSNAIVNFLNGTYWFEGGLTITGDATVGFENGTYLFGSSSSGSASSLAIDSGGSVCTGTAVAVGTCNESGGSLFYVEGGAATLSGGGTLSLSAGPQDQGVALWDAAASGSNDELAITAGGSSIALGGIYAPNGELYLDGGGQLQATFVAANTVSVANGATLAVG